MMSLEDTVSRGFRAPVSSTCNPIWSPCSENKKGLASICKCVKKIATFSAVIDSAMPVFSLSQNVSKCLNCTGKNQGKWNCKKSGERFANNVSLLGTFSLVTSPKAICCLNCSGFDSEGKRMQISCRTRISLHCCCGQLAWTYTNN